MWRNGGVVRPSTRIALALALAQLPSLVGQVAVDCSWPNYCSDRSDCDSSDAGCVVGTEEQAEQFPILTCVVSTTPRATNRIEPRARAGAACELSVELCACAARLLAALRVHASSHCTPPTRVAGRTQALPPAIQLPHSEPYASQSRGVGAVRGPRVRLHGRAAAATGKICAPLALYVQARAAARPLGSLPHFQMRTWRSYSARARLAQRAAHSVP